MVRRRPGSVSYSRQIEQRCVDELPAGDTLIRVRYSSLNYKDALSATGHRGITRKYPHTPGIDAAGVVEAGGGDRFGPGDEVVVTGYDLGMNTAGGFGQYIRVPSEWVVAKPAGLSLEQCMVLGTAGLTAAWCVHRLCEVGVEAGGEPVLVTGATGGVGSLAVVLLARAGYRVVAATGKVAEAAYLKQLGAAEVVGREDVRDTSGRGLLAERWAGVVDTVGGETLNTALKSTRFGGAVTCCGMVESAELVTTVYPQILRAVALLGVASAECPMATRLMLWDRLAASWDQGLMDAITTRCMLNELDGWIDKILAGQVRGRIVGGLDG